MNLLSGLNLFSERQVPQARPASETRRLPLTACRGALCMVLGLIYLLAWCAAADAAPRYAILDLGLTGPEHTRNDGYKWSSAGRPLEAGQVLGLAERFNGGGTWLGYSAWLYNGSTTFDIGLVGPEHTRDDGYKYSLTYHLNEAGQAVGTANRYNGGGTELGYSVWLYNGTTTLDIGLTGLEHTRDDGYKYSGSYQLNQAGQATGIAERYNGGGTPLGQSAWLYNGTTTLDIGPAGPGYTSNDGYKSSSPFGFNEAGQVVGLAERYNGAGTYLGWSTWLYNGSTTLDIGPAGPGYTNNDGLKHSYPRGFNEAGQVSGAAARFNSAGADLGRSAWLYNGSTTLDIGLTGPEHTRNDGWKDSEPYQLNQAGQVIGTAQRYNGGGNQLGLSVWLYNGATTLGIGLAGSEHTRNDGYKFSSPRQLNEAGQVVGYAARFNGGGTSLGRSAWLYNGTTTLDIGLTGPEHTRSDGYKNSLPYNELQLNEAGQVLGTAERFNGGGNPLGHSVWLYNGTTTLDIGLVGPEHTRNDGYKYSEARFGRLNEAGQVLGVAHRFNGGGTQLGQDAWVYDPVLGETIALQPSMRSDGYAYSSASYWGDDGVVLGSYNLYDGMTLLGERALYWSRDHGLWDLGALVEGGLDDNGWAALHDAYQSNGLGQIIGYGRASGLPDGSRSAFLLTPVPEPSGMALALLASCVLWFRRRLCD